MSIKVTEKNDYGFLFDSLNRNSTNTLNLDLSDYASIKNGSYGKLLKAYYAQKSDEAAETSTTKKDKSTDKVSNEKVQELTTVATDASALQDTTEKLMKKGSDSVFNKVTINSVDDKGDPISKTEYDTDAIYNSVNDFVGKYNSFVKDLASADSETMQRYLTTFHNAAGGFRSSLENVGISIQEDNTLAIDEKAFKAANMESVSKLFTGNSSFAYTVSTRASMIGATAASEANSMKNYDNSGNYSDAYSVGNLLNSIV